jgi:hypothetical protein
LDLIFTNEENMIETLQYDAPIGKSHHSCIRFELKCYSDKTRTKCSSLNFARADFEAIRQKVSALTDNTLDNTDVNGAWEQISSTISSAINECVPKSTWDPDKPRRPMWIRRTFSYMDTTLLSWLFKAMVRPHLEYCHTVAHPRTVAQTQAIEGVLRRASKLIQELRDLPYATRLQHLKMPSMHYRFRRGDMIILYKYTHHFVD